MQHPSIVPFRHSKLTELFKSTFEGDGKAVISHSKYLIQGEN